MAGTAGRNIVLTWGVESPAEEIPGVREKGIELNGEMLDVTSDENDGWRELLNTPAQNQVQVSLSGVTKSARLKVDWFAGNRINDVTITYPDGGVITGNFFLESYTETATYNEAVAFEATLQSTGVIAYTPGSPA
jgi:predicted secreted protein